MGGVLGAALGYRHVFVGAELNLLYTAGKADVFFKERDLSAFGAMPAVYVWPVLTRAALRPSPPPRCLAPPPGPLAPSSRAG